VSCSWYRSRLGFVAFVLTGNETPTLARCFEPAVGVLVVKRLFVVR
jgi:hypothetical protein